MRKCEKCNIEMTDAKLHGEPFSMDLDNDIDDFSIRYINDVKEVKGLFGKNKMKTYFSSSKLKAAVCKKCGKVELYIDIGDTDIC